MRRRGRAVGLVLACQFCIVVVGYAANSGEHHD
jgi:hypothetical protein